LKSCFAAVFPRLNDAEIVSAVSSDVEQWDSIATVRLVTVIEEEFDVPVELDELGSELSFAGILDYLQQRGAAA